LQQREADIRPMFNPQFSLEEWIAAGRPYLGDFESSYREKIEGGLVEVEGMCFVHTKDISSDLTKKHVFFRSWLKLPVHLRRNDIKCSLHSRKCQIVEYSAGFILYLHLILEEHSDATDETSAVGGELACPRSGTLQVLKGVQLPKGALPTSILPTIPIGDLHYVMLNDIMELFDLREDYCLAIVAQNLKEEDAIIDPEQNKYETTLPTEEEFKAVQERLGITDMGRTHSSTLSQASTSRSRSKAEKSVHLWNKPLVEEDENQKLIVYDDDFIPRPRGRGMGDLGKNSSLGQYLKNFNYPRFLVFHSSFSNDNADVPLMTLKTLSRYLGGALVRWNVDKIMLLEMQAALTMFSQGPGVYGLRSRYFLTQAAYGLACGITDPGPLIEYGKHDLLRNKVPVLARIEEVPFAEVEIETVVLDLNVPASEEADAARSAKRPREEEDQQLDEAKRLEYFVTFPEDED
ncbi:hypothetical protein L7F22_054622, partial [Adiantum nelumboides]|nr:hypothetical protein [Adiantum nelumboides]